MEQMVAGFALARPLGRGGMGQVFEARRADYAAPLAIKLLPPGGDSRAVQRLLREGELLTRLEHPNVIRVFEVGVSQGQPYVAMEILAGVALSALIADLIAAKRRPAAALVSEIAAGMARGLEAAHAAGVLHRDIKPSNVVITTEGRVVVLDFGIALEAGNSRMTASGEVTGTPVYLSPEQATASELDRRSDIYQFGLILHELIALERPYAGMRAMDALTQRLQHGVPSLLKTLPDADRHLTALADSCLRRAPEKRPASFEEVLGRLAKVPGSREQLAAAIVKLAPPPQPEAAAAAPAPRPAALPTQVGEWALIERLGQGGMGVVFRARRPDGAESAVKLLHPNLLERVDVVRRFAREVRIASELSHPGLVKIVEADTSSALPWFAMELITGETLSERLRRETRLPAPECGRILTELASALAVLHGAGLAHRDLKPGNVMVESSGRIRLMDLGLVGGDDLTRVTRTGSVLGTPLYMPPEFHDGEFGPAGDLYQLGLILHEMMTGDRTVNVQLGPEGPRLPTEVAASPALAAVYRAVLRSDPAARPKTAADIVQMLLAPAPARPIQAGPTRKMATPPEVAEAAAEPRTAAPGPKEERPPVPPVRLQQPARPAVPAPASPPAGAAAGLPVPAPVRPPAARPPPPEARSAWLVLRQSTALATTVVKYGLVALTIAVSLGVLAILPSLLARFGGP